MFNVTPTSVTPAMTSGLPPFPMAEINPFWNGKKNYQLTHNAHGIEPHICQTNTVRTDFTPP